MTQKDIAEYFEIEQVVGDAGIPEMLMTFNVVGVPKLRRLAALAKRTNISVVADNTTVVAGLGRMQAGTFRFLSRLKPVLSTKPAVGDCVDALPNHVCPMSNLFDRIALVRSGKLLGLTKVDARGCVW